MIQPFNSQRQISIMLIFLVRYGGKVKTYLHYRDDYYCRNGTVITNIFTPENVTTIKQTNKETKCRRFRIFLPP